MHSTLKPFDEDVRMALEGKIKSEDPVSFKAEYTKIVRSCREPAGIVYVWNTEIEIPRLRGRSRVLYIGKTVNSLSARYADAVIKEDTRNYWQRISFILRNFGGISIDVYPANDPNQSENDFMFSYFQNHLEMPPFNNQAFSMSKLTCEQSTAFYEGIS